jgi:hypothetical protein
MLDTDVVGEIRVLVRIPPELHAALKTIAGREMRSLNSEIIYLLKRAVEQQDQARRGLDG